VPIQIGAEEYPGNIIEELKNAADTVVIDAGDIAKKIGTFKVMNIVLLGALVKAMGISGLDWEALIKSNVKEGFADLNIKAFAAGYGSI
jgi:indolepyruvate ferredoxin oxidoreductase beta subunit